MKRCFSVSIFALSALFALITTLGKQGSSIYRLSVHLAFFFGIVAIYYAVLYFLEKQQLQIESLGPDRSARIFIQRPFLLVFCALLVCWLPYVILCFPGNITYDTGTSILSHLGMIDNPNNPAFLNYLYGWLYRAGVWLGALDVIVFLSCLIQLLLFALVLSRSIVLVYKSRAPQIVAVALFLLYAILPVFPVYAFTLGKDSSFALLTLVLGLLVYECCIEDGERWKNWHSLLLFATVLLLPLVRNYAIWIVLLSLFPLVKKKRMVRLPLIAAIATTALFRLMVPAPAGDIAEVLPLPIQQTGYVVREYDIPEDEMAAISAVLPLHVFNSYNPGNADPLKDNFLGNNDALARRNYYRVWFAQMLRYPAAYAKAFYLLTNGYYTPEVLRNDLKPHIFLGYSVNERVLSDTAISPNKNPGLSIVQQIDNAFSSMPIIGVFQRIGIYTWILIYTAFNGFRRKIGLPMLCLLPSFLVFLGCCLGPVNAYFRYALPLVVSAPVLCSLIFFTPKDAFLVKPAHAREGAFRVLESDRGK